MIRRLFACPECDNRLTRAQAVLGWCWLPMHLFVVPLLVSMIAVYAPVGLDGADVNLICYAVDFAFVLAVMGPWLRRNFYVLLDSPGRCVLCLLTALAVDYEVSLLVQIILLLLEQSIENPNNAQVAEYASYNYGAMKAAAVYLAPVVEETLFRGVVFGTIRRKNRVAAYAVSMLLFGLYHVWQYALLYADPWQLVYMAQYLPAAFVLSWQYERSGSIWTSIAFHMLLNALSLFVLSYIS